MSIYFYPNGDDAELYGAACDEHTDLEAERAIDAADQARTAARDGGAL